MPVVRSMGDLRDFLAQWDKASKTSREKILHDFVKRSRNMTGPELEREYGNGASLLLTRICAYLRTRTLAGTSIGMSMQAISIFVSASSGHRFLVEFLDSGGLQMVLQVIRNTKIDEADRMKALQVLFSISNAGYTYKELICEPPTNGISSVCEFLCEVESETAHELTRSVLIGLSRGNKRAPELQTNLIPKLTSSKPLVQRTAAQVIRQLLSPPEVEGIKAISPEPSLVPALRNMLACTHVHVMYEAQELANCALVHESTRKDMIATTLELLRPGEYSYRRPVDTPSEHDLGSDNSPASIAYFSAQPPPECLILQAAACRLLASFLKSKAPKREAAQPEVVKLLVASDAVSGILVALANDDYAESKKHAVDCIKALTRTSREADDRFLECTGQSFYQRFQADPAACAATLNAAGLKAMLEASGAADKSVAASFESAQAAATTASENTGGGGGKGEGNGGSEEEHGKEAEEETGSGHKELERGGEENSRDHASGDADIESMESGKGGGGEAESEDKDRVGAEGQRRGEGVAGDDQRVAAPELSAADTYAEASGEDIGFNKATGEGEEGARDDAAVGES